MDKLEKLESAAHTLLDERAPDLPFHGWKHVDFVRRKGRLFAEAIGADRLFVESAALVHDLNYLEEKRSGPGAGRQLRTQLLTAAGYSAEEMKRIESVINESHVGTRTANISKEGQALSDADTLFKALPTTPIIFASKYIAENDVDVAKLARKVVEEQQPLLEQGIYFYTDLAKRQYLAWAKVNLQLWSNVQEALRDPDVARLLE